MPESVTGKARCPVLLLLSRSTKPEWYQPPCQPPETRTKAAMYAPSCINACHSNLFERRRSSVALTLCILGFLAEKLLRSRESQARLPGPSGHVRPLSGSARYPAPEPAAPCQLCRAAPGAGPGGECPHRGNSLTAARNAELPRRSEGLHSRPAIPTTSGPIPEPRCGSPAPP